MGIRPNFHVVIGLHGVKKDDPRYKRPKDIYELDAIPLVDPENYIDDKRDWEWMEKYTLPRELSSVVYNAPFTSEYRAAGVTGLIVESGPYASEIWYALASLDQKYVDAGFALIPELDPGTNGMRAKHYGYNDEDIRCHRFLPFESYPPRMDWKRAVWYLAQAGWTVKEEDLRKMLVWDWG